MAASSSRVLRCTPRRSCFSVSAANQRSTRLIHEELVGVKCRWKRGWRVSQRWIAGVLWVLELSRIQVHLERGRDARMNGVEKRPELARPLAPPKLRDQFPALRVEGRKQRCRAVARVVVSA